MLCVRSLLLLGDLGDFPPLAVHSYEQLDIPTQPLERAG